MPQEYRGSTQASNLRLNLQEREDDMNMARQGSLKNIETIALEGPMTRERLKKLQEIQREISFLKDQREPNTYVW
ncbi:hypothetical protein CR513_23746, partial [Mucuna pruriens]